MTKTLKDCLLDRRVLGEIFSYNGSSHAYKVIGLHIGEDKSINYVCLVVNSLEENPKEEHYNLADRLNDIHRPQKQPLQQSKQPKNRGCQQLITDIGDKSNPWMI